MIYHLFKTRDRALKRPSQMIKQLEVKCLKWTLKVDWRLLSMKIRGVMRRRSLPRQTKKNLHFTPCSRPWLSSSRKRLIQNTQKSCRIDILWKYSKRKRGKEFISKIKGKISENITFKSDQNLKINKVEDHWPLKKELTLIDVWQIVAILIQNCQNRKAL